MRSLLRLVLLCVMAVALPLQGYAATGAVHCGAMHGRMQVESAHHHDDGAVHQHGAHDGHAAHAAASHAAPAVDAPSDDGATPTGGVAKCSACAACCVGLGLPAGVITMPQGPAEGAAPTLAPLAVPTFLTSGPERPPRAILA